MANIITKAILEPLCWMDSAWRGRDVQIPQEHKNSVAFLAIMYFFQLLTNRLIEVTSIFYVDKKNDFDPKICQFWGTLLGAILSVLFLWWLRKNDKNKYTIKIVLGISSCLLAFAYLYFFWNFNIISINPDQLRIVKFFIGVGNATFIGLAITWVCETVFRNLRTSAALYIGFWGFIGAMIASSIDKYNDNIILKVLNCQQKTLNLFPFDSKYEYFCILPVLLILLSGLLFKKNILKDAKLVSMSEKSSNKKLIKKLQEIWTKNGSLIVFSFLIGLTVQFWVFFAGHSEQLFGHGKGASARYLGAVLGSICFIFYFQNNSRRRRDIPLAVIFFLSIILCVVLLMIRLFCCNEISDIGLDAIYIITGLLSSIWIVSILYVAEQFDLKLRLWLIILSPNVFRASEIILHSRTHNFVSNANSLDYSDDLYEGILLWGIVFSLLGLLALLVLNNENYEGDPLKTGVDADGEIDKAEILKKISEVEARDPKAFFEKANQEIHDHLKDVLNLQYYLISTYYKIHSNVEHTKYESIEHTKYEPNKKAFDCNSTDKYDYNIEHAHSISAELIKEGRHHSYINELFKNNDYFGGLMYLPSRKNRKMKSKGFKDFKLDEINLAQITGIEVQQTIKYENKQMYENIQIGSYGEYESKDKKLLQTFALFRIDANTYNPDTYFLYIIKPISNEPRCTLVIKTAIELSEDNLKRLRNLISTVQGKWDEINGTTQSEMNYENLLRLLSKSLSTHAIRNTFLKLKECVTSESRSDEDKLNTIDNLSMLLTSNMASESKILIGKELKFLKSYMFYYLNNKRSDAPAEIQEKIDSAVRNKILPFNWKIDFPVELKNVYMPKAIIQPMVENAFKYSGYKMNELNELGLKVEFKRIANEVEEDTADIEICVSNSIKPETKINLDEVKQKILFGKPNALAHNSLHLIWQRLNYEIKNKSSEDGVLIIPEVRGNKFLLTCKIIGCRFEKRAEQRPTMNLAQKKVLLIEDNAEDVFKTKEIITGEGNRTLKGDIKIERVVNTLNEARDVLKGKHPFNIVIVDLMLSKDGEEDYWTTQIFEELSQENIELAEIGIIFLSGESSKESDVSIFMTKRFPKNYLGFSTKFEDTYDDLDNFLNIYYEKFKK